MKILIVKLSSLGDVVHAMPAVQDMLRAMPDAQIDWVVERGFAPLVQRCQGVHRVIACELRRWRKAPLNHDTRRAWTAFKAELQQQAYDAVIDLQGLTKSALIAWLARLADGGKRYGLANQTEGSSFEAPARWVAHDAITLPAHSHAVTRSRELCAQALHYRLPDVLVFGLVARPSSPPHLGNDHEQEAGLATWREGELRGTVALVHGTSRADKEWPLAHWRELAQRLNDTGFDVGLPHGSPAEQQTAHDIAHGLAHARVWPRLSLDALTDALATCSGVIGVDSGLSHIAVALDLPHVQIYNFDTAWRTGPLVGPGTDSCGGDFSPPWSTEVEPAKLQKSVRQCSVFAQPTPSVDAVWQTWLGVFSNAPLA
ncbi:MAG: lipopolysaccharide heptosyltransferase I [Comamonadaceae bacterium CG_4_9_14_3_um_filter_60_33]|nr:MAG: lipopolysaccharide heptosyltransferase I [Comamonadaceae bacterium CG_4_10_14_3_um_filter_60_42]PJB46832.1 MAG: lipopolysaccharide heptosyltransferase I [Comamonadaceae bacterium CG_4_9_14_3_um_filter_60_33]